MKRFILYIVFLLISFEGLGQTLPTPQNPSASIDYYNTVSLNFSFDATGLFSVPNTGQSLYFEIEVDNGTTTKVFRTSNYTIATASNVYTFSKTMAHGFSYIFKVKAFYKESTFGATLTSAQSIQSNNISASNPRGITVLTHGFSATGALDPSWKANARALRNRLSSETGSGKGATILINNTSTGLWEFLEGENGSLDLNEEIIFLFDWANISNTPLLGNQTGYLESAADVLYSILTNPTVKQTNGQLTQLGGLTPGQLLIDKNTHFIGHSRGTIVMLQLLHRLKANFSPITVERLTLLDPHPAGTFGDVKRADIAGSPENLPGVYGAAATCSPMLCYDGGQSIYLTVPDNVLKVEDFYRQGDAYEPPAEIFGGISPFMGVPLVGGNNSYLMNNDIMTYGSGYAGGAHSAVPTWYFQTVDLLQPTTSYQTDWFSTAVGTFMTGKTRATAGYNITNLPNVPIKATLVDYNNALNVRTGQGTLTKVFNGNFGYGNGAGWRLNNLGFTEPTVDNTNKWLVLHPKYITDGSNTLSNVATHNIMYFPANFTSLSMDVKLDFGSYTGTVVPKLIIEYYNASGQKFRQAFKTLSLIPTAQFSRIHFGLPGELQGKNGTFRLFFADNGALNDYHTSNLKILIDNVELSNETSIVNPPVITASKTTIQSGQSVILSATGCANGIIYWTTGEKGTTISVSPFETTGYSSFCEQDGYFSNPSNAIAISVTYSSTLSNAEYFIDTDPGIGIATPFSISVSGHINQTVAINLAPLNLPQGVHSIGIRVKDQNNKWSLTHTKTFLVLGTSSGGGNSIADVEYFIDSLKQDRSNLVSTGISSANNALISVPVLQNIPQGVHSISFRVKDNQGKYSLFHTKTYLVLGSGVGGSTLSKVEYFFDNDPGFGNGTQVNYSASNDATQLIDIDVNGLTTGVHVLNVRVKNLANQWSLTHAKVFLIMPHMGGNATVSQIEYFIDDNDLGQGSATNVVFTPNPDSKNVIASFDLDVSNYTPGIHRISARVKDSENRWSPVVTKAFEFFPPVSIVALSEINEPNYTVPRESTIHHYYLIKETLNNQPVRGVIIKYQVGTDPTVRVSLPSDADGIVDLNIKTGGENLTSNTDDWIKILDTFTPVQFNSIDKFPATTLNEFSINPFNVKVINKVVPFDKEIEMGLGISIAAWQANTKKHEKKAKVGNAEFSVGPKLGASIMLGPSLSYKQNDTNPAIWHVKSRLGIGASGEAGFEASAEVGKFSAELNGSVNAEIATIPGIYFDFNTNDARQVFEFAKKLIFSKSFLPPGLYKAANFFRRASIDNSFPPSPFTYTGSSIGASLSGSINGNFKIEYAPKIVQNQNGYAKWLQTGGGMNLSGSRNMGVEIESEKLKNSGRSLSVTTYSGVEMNAEFELLSNLTRRGDLNWWKASLPLKAYSSSTQNGNTLVNYYSTNDDLLETEVNQSSQKIVSVNGLSTLKVTYNNITTFGPEARGLLLVAKDNALLGNSIANFMYSNRPTYFNYVNNIVTGLPLQSFSQSFLDAKTYIVNNFSPYWDADQLKQEVTRNYSLELPEVALEIPRLEGKLVDFKYNVSNNYTFDLEKSKFSKTYKRVFPTISLADNETNLDLPFSNPIGDFFTKLKTNTEALPQNLFDKFMDFVIPIRQIVSNTFVCLGNGGCPSSSQSLSTSKQGKVIRKDLNANIIYDGQISKTISNSQNEQPSLMNFSINPAPQVFNTGTQISFDYYYPENNLLATTATDTMRIVSDVFTLYAYLNTTELNQAPNGNFVINTTWNSNDLVLAGMPQNLVPKIIFKPNGSSIWQIIGDVNQAINFNQLGVFAFGVSLDNDLVPPVIDVQAPNTFAQGQVMTISITDNLSGINWSNTSIFINGNSVSYTHTGSQIQLTLPASTDNTYFLQVLTYDYSFNYKSYERVYPCSVSSFIRSLEGRSDSPIIEKVSNFIEIDTSVPATKNIILNAGKNIVFRPGFKIEAGQAMTAEVKGCNN